MSACDPEQDDIRHSAPALVAAGEVRGVDVVGPCEERLGRICDLAIDRLSGRVAYVLLAVRSRFGLRRRIKAAPWGALHYDATRDAYRTTLGADDLRPVPALSTGPLSGWAARRGAREADLHTKGATLAWRR